jgi:hypothetical protein
LWVRISWASSSVNNVFVSAPECYQASALNARAQNLVQSAQVARSETKAKEKEKETADPEVRVAAIGQTSFCVSVELSLSLCLALVSLSLSLSQSVPLDLSASAFLCLCLSRSLFVSLSLSRSVCLSVSVSLVRLLACSYFRSGRGFRRPVRPRSSGRWKEEGAPANDPLPSAERDRAAVTGTTEDCTAERHSAPHRN